MSSFFVKNNGKEYEAEVINSRIVYTVRYKDSGIVEDNVEEYRLVDLFPPNIEGNSYESNNVQEKKETKNRNKK